MALQRVERNEGGEKVFRVLYARLIVRLAALAFGCAVLRLHCADRLGQGGRVRRPFYSPCPLKQGYEQGYRCLDLFLRLGMQLVAPCDALSRFQQVPADELPS
jgi:hypothetical protein